jgi:hypothetical protein
MQTLLKTGRSMRGLAAGFFTAVALTRMFVYFAASLKTD